MDEGITKKSFPSYNDDTCCLTLSSNITDAPPALLSLVTTIISGRYGISRLSSMDVITSFIDLILA